MWYQVIPKEVKAERTRNHPKGDKRNQTHARAQIK